jgi:curli biogenesis system outer membrane secretion channel CsgG
MKRLHLIFVPFLILSTSNFATSQVKTKTNIAIFNLETRGGLSASEATILTDRLRSSLVQTNAFVVVDRGKMEEILKEVGFQQTGCTTSECVVEAGKILNVQQMVTGSVGKFGSLYSIDIILIDVATSQIIKTFTQNYKGELEGLLDFMTPVANQVAGFEKQKAESPKPKKTFTLKINSIPVDATVVINNKAAGKTPFHQMVEEGTKVSILVGKQSYKEWSRTFTMDRDIDLSAELETVEKLSRDIAQQPTGTKKSKKWLWITGGIVAGGTVAILLAGGKKSKSDLPGIENIAWPPHN